MENDFKDNQIAELEFILASVQIKEKLPEPSCKNKHCPIKRENIK